MDVLCDGGYSNVVQATRREDIKGALSHVTAQGACLNNSRRVALEKLNDVAITGWWARGMSPQSA